MFSGIYFLFPKLFFIFFIYLGCESLCPLRSSAILFPRLELLEEKKSKNIWWVWVSKWAMVIFLVIAVASPVSDIEQDFKNDSVMIVIDPQTIEKRYIDNAIDIIDSSNGINYGLYIPSSKPIILPPTPDKERLKMMLNQIDIVKSDRVSKLNYLIDMPVVLYSNESDFESFVGGKKYIKIAIEKNQSLYRYYSFYPLFFALIAMMIYLYGRNQKGYG